MDGARAGERLIDDHEAVASTSKYCEAIKWTKGKTVSVGPRFEPRRFGPRPASGERVGRGAGVVPAK